MAAFLNFLVSAVVVCAALLWVYWNFVRPGLKRRSASKELAALAQTHGFSFRARDRRLESWLDHPPFDRGTSRWYRQVLCGSHRGRTLWLFTYHALDTNSEDEAFFTVVGLNPAAPDAPAVRILPVEGRQLLLEWKRRRRLPRGEPVVESPSGDPGYRVVSSAPAYADRLQQQVITLLRPWPGMSFGLDGGALLLIDRGHSLEHWVANVEQLLPTLDALVELVELVEREQAAQPTVRPRPSQY